MGDGYARPQGLILCTDSYSVQDIVRLMNVLIIRYRLKCTLRYHTSTQPRIYISERSMPLLRTIVRPHVLLWLINFSLGKRLTIQYLLMLDPDLLLLVF